MSGRKLVNLSLVLSVISMMSSPLAVLAKPSTSKESKPKPEYIMDTSRIGQSNNGMILSNQILELGVVTPSALRLQGEQAIRMGNISRAIQVLQKAVEMNPLDMDGRVLYATALEKKLIKQKKRDPKLYNYVIIWNKINTSVLKEFSTNPSKHSLFFQDILKPKEHISIHTQNLEYNPHPL